MKIRILLITFICLLGSLPAFTQMESEPNNNFDDANILSFSSLSVTLQGSIGQNGDNDYYAVNIPFSGVFEVRLSNVPSNIGGRIWMYNANRNEVRDIDGNNGQPIGLNQLVCEPGIYFFRIGDSNNSGFNSLLYTLNITLYTSDIYECNQDFSTATSIALGEEIRASIYSRNDNDYYAVEIPRAGVLEARLDSLPPNIGGRIWMYNANLSEIRDVDSNNGQPVGINQLVCDPGTYYFRINDSNLSDSSPDLYRFVVRLDTSDIYECNQDFSTAKLVEVCDSIKGAIYSGGDQDYYSFMAIQEEQIGIKLLNVPSNLSAIIRIYNDVQNLLVERSGSNGQPLLVNFNPSYTGLHFIRIQGTSNNSQLYTLYLDQENCVTNVVNTQYEDQITLSPNPTTSILNIHFPVTTGKTEIYLTDVSGKRCLQKSIQGTEQATLDMARLPDGVYFISFVHEEYTTVRKVLKNSR